MSKKRKTGTEEIEDALLDESSDESESEWLEVKDQLEPEESEAPLKKLSGKILNGAGVEIDSTAKILDILPERERPPFRKIFRFERNGVVYTEAHQIPFATDEQLLAITGIQHTRLQRLRLYFGPPKSEDE